MKQNAFTMAEILITLGIIGVVAVLTMPTMIQNTQKKTYTTQLRKVNSEFQQATLNYINSKNALNLREAGVVNKSTLNDMIKANMKTVIECASASDCFAPSYKNINGEAANPELGGYTAYLLPSGAAISGDFDNTSGVLTIDVNGKKGPNTIGRDLFAAGIDINGTLSNAVSSDAGSSHSSHSSHSASTPLEKCKSASGYRMAHGVPQAAHCFNVIVDDDWEMKY